MFHFHKKLLSLLTLSILCTQILSSGIEEIHASEFGITTPGTNVYPSNGLEHVARTVFNSASNFISSARDEAGGYVYMSTDTAPAKVIKVRISDFQQVGSLSLLPGEDYSNSTRIDPANDIGYLGLSTSPAKIVKFRLSTMERLDSLSFSTGENNISWGDIDTTRGFAYYALNTSPGHVVKVNLNTFSQEAVFSFNTGEDNLKGIRVDPVSNILYIGSQSTRTIMRLDLNTFTRMTDHPEIVLPSGNGSFSHSELDTNKDYLYMATANSAAKIHKIHIAGGDFTLEDTISLNSGETGIWGMEWIQSTSDLYAVVSTDPAEIVQIHVGAPGVGSMTRGSTLTLNPGEDRAYAVQRDTLGNIYVGTYNSPSEIVKIATSPALARVSAINMTPNQDDLHDSAMEPDGSIGYYLTSDQPGRVTKVDLKTMQWQGAITLPLDNSTPAHQPDVATNGMLLDHIHHKLYVSVDSWTANDYIEVIDTNTFSITNRITLASGSMDYAAQMMDAAGNYAYFTTCNSQSPKVFKLDINPSSGTFQQVVATSAALEVATTGSTNRCTRSMVMDENDGPGYIYIGQRSAGAIPGQVHKVRMTDLTKISTLTLPAGFDTVNALAIDKTARNLYVGLGTSPGKVVKVDLNTFTQTASLDMAVNENKIKSLGYDPTTNYVYAAVQGATNSTVIRIDGTSFTRLGSSTLPGSDISFFRGDYDYAHGLAYFGADTLPASLVKVSLTKKNKPFMTKVTLSETANVVNSLRFYSHQGTGNVRLGLYGSDGKLKWESNEIANSTTGGWIRAAIADGTPSSLTLPAGDYYLAFQLDTDSPVASYVLGAANTGEFSVVPYGAFPQDFTLIYNRVSTTDNYVMSAIYNDAITVTESAGSTQIVEGTSTDTIDYVLTSAPKADVTVNLTPAGALSLSSANLTFTPANWNVVQTVTVSHPQDGIAQGNRNQAISYSITSTDEDYAALSLPNTSVSITDNNLPGAPSTLFANSSTNGAQTAMSSPAQITGTSLAFSGIFQDADTGDTATKYQLQIATDKDFTAIQYDSGAGGTALTAPLANNARSENITPTGFTGTFNTTYYWRLKFWDALGNAGSFSPSGVGAMSFTLLQPGTPIISGSGGGYAPVEERKSTPVNSTKPSAPQQNTTTQNQNQTQSSTQHATPSTTSDSPRTEQISSTNPVGRFNIPFKETVCADMAGKQETIAVEKLSEQELRSYVESLVKKGVIFSQSAGAFDPNTSVSRSELLRYAIQSNCEDYRALTLFDEPFPDVPVSHKDALFIALAKMKHIVSGYLHNGLYKPDNTISRAEALKVVIEIALGDGTRTFEGSSQPFTDIAWEDPEAWYRGYISFAYEKGIITLPESKEFRPNDEATVSEILLMLGRALALKQG